MIGSRLGERASDVAEFIARALILLDELTDGRMLYDAPAHLVAVVCGLDVRLAAHLASILDERCRTFRCESIAHALKDHGHDIERLRDVFAEEAPDVELGEVKEDEDPREGFVSSDEVLETGTEKLVSQLTEGISSSSFGSAFHTFPAVIRALLHQGNVTATVSVFEQFERAMRELLACYPSPGLRRSP